MALLIAGYLEVWILFGILVYAGDWALHQAVRQSAWLMANAWMLGALVLILAGVYQFTPLKYYCLDKCRSPMSFILGHWHGRDEAQQAFALGIHHGLFCVGCCWALMALGLLAGLMNVVWMAAIAVIAILERTLPEPRAVTYGCGIGLLAAGILLAAFG